MSLPAETHSWTTNLEGISNLTLATTPTPSPHDLPPDTLLIRIHAISLNYKDAEIISGQFKHHKYSIAPPNLIPCADSVGVIVAVGPSSHPPTSTNNNNHTTTPPQPWKVGDRVLSLSYPNYLTGPASPLYLSSGVGSAINGVLTTYRVFPRNGVVLCPPHLTDTEAACLPIAGTTAWMGLNWWRPLLPADQKRTPRERKGETLLVQGTGGVSMFGALMGKALGMRVVCTSGDWEKLERAKREWGVDEGVNYRETKEWDVEVLKLTKGQGADVIFENGGGGGSTARSFRCVRFGGVIDSIGYVGGKVDRLEGLGAADPERLNVNVLALARNVTVKGLLNGPRDRMEEMLRFVEEHQIRPTVDKVFQFQQAKEALAYMWDGKHFGKVVIRANDQ